ncbi:Nse1 non-SMC component of SMC5-6 complex-domain-containing protein [Mycena alexandri]|uniref:Non-structural maintenance of chromosomes element 1 homolog n=1 Tax=Mycena alexandri TaxID=1745969 RepID=A0AAD6XIW3_9AGAR|nr:Nse1 non-SMC component of SMC5-6 complex-domain-containing protein [Mycena alexandri]
MSAVHAKDVQRLFLQAVLSRGVLSGKLAQTIWAKSKEAVMAANDSLDIPHSGNVADWEAFVAKVNKDLDPLDLEFRHQLEEVSGKDIYAIVNRKGDEIAQMATDYTPGEITFFKAMVEQIMLAPRRSFSISSLAALREVSALKPKSNMSKTQTEIVLASFVAKGWLLKSKRGRYSLSTRALLELKPYLESTYAEEVLECTICSDIITKGVACPQENCQVGMHYSCFTKYIRTRRQCTSCTKDWPADPDGMPPIGEGAVRDGEDGKRRIRKSVDSDEEDEGSDDDEPSQPRTQQSRKGKGKKKAADDMDVDEEEEDKGEESDTPVQKGKRRARRS